MPGSARYVDEVLAISQALLGTRYILEYVMVRDVTVQIAALPSGNR